MKQRRAIGYARVSTEKQDLVRQQDLIRAYCENNSLDLIRIIQEKISGAKENRKSIADLLSIDNEIADIVVISEFSRLSRESDIIKVLSYVNDLLENGLDIVFLNEPEKIYEAYSKLSLTDIITISVKAQAAADERKNISIRLNTGKTSKVIQNSYAYAGGIVPYGYKLIANEEYAGVNDHIHAKTLQVIDDTKIADVVYIFTKITEQVSSIKVAEICKEQGINLSKYNICDMIKNPIYKGQRKYKGNLYPVEPIISEELWNEANVALDNNKMFKDNSTRHSNPFKGILKCACGKGMQLQRDGVNKEYLRYKCLTTNDGYERCSNVGISKEVVLKSVWQTIKIVRYDSLFEDSNNIQKERISGYIDILEEKKYNINNEIDEVKKELARITTAISKVTQEGLITRLENQYITNEDKLASLEESKRSIQAEITENRTKLNTIGIDLDIDKEVTEAEQAEIFRRLLDKVVYYSFDKAKGFLSIEFKNGMNPIVAVNRIKYERECYLLPSSFGFNRENRKVIVEHPKTDSFASDFKEYDINELFDKFDMSEYKLSIKIEIKNLKKRRIKKVSK